jgi:hypothetical protein
MEDGRMDEYETAADNAADLRKQASDLWRQAEALEEAGDDAWAMSRRDNARRYVAEAERLETDPEYAAQMEAAWNPVETGIPALRPDEVAEEIVRIPPRKYGAITTYGGVAGYAGDDDPDAKRRLFAAAGYRLTPPPLAPPVEAIPIGRDTSARSRPREHRSGRAHSRRGPPSDDDHPGDVDPPLNRCKQQAERLTPEQLDDLSTFARIRAKWLRTGRRWES